jgi:hypothetical protein
MLFAVLYILWDRFMESASRMVGKYLSAEFLCGSSSLLNKARVTQVYKQALTTD